MLTLIKSILPADVEVIVIGDGEFDGINFLETIESYGWFFAVRTAKNSCFSKNGFPLKLPKNLSSGTCLSWDNVDFTSAYYGPLKMIAWKPIDTDEIIYLISNCQTALLARQCYKKRIITETFFSDLKTR